MLHVLTKVHALLYETLDYFSFVTLVDCAKKYLNNKQVPDGVCNSHIL